MLHLILAFFVALALVAPAFVLVILVAAWRAHAPQQKFGTYAAESLMRFWRFWGRRLGDKKFQGALYALIAAGLGTYLAPAQAQAWLLALTLLGAFLFPTWEDLPFETLEGPAPAPRIDINGPVQVSSR